MVYYYYYLHHSGNTPTSEKMERAQMFFEMLLVETGRLLKQRTKEFRKDV